LGLSFVKDIVEKHGGTINLKSQLKEGTTFTIELFKNSKDD
jgi:signal transduction histidine kinase